MTPPLPQSRLEEILEAAERQLSNDPRITKQEAFIVLKNSDAYSLVTELIERRRQVEVAERALGFYADKRHVRYRHSAAYIGAPIAEVNDEGETAQRALKDMKGGGNG